MALLTVITIGIMEAESKEVAAETEYEGAYRGRVAEHDNEDHEAEVGRNDLVVGNDYEGHRQGKGGEVTEVDITTEKSAPGHPRRGGAEKGMFAQN